MLTALVNRPGESGHSLTSMTSSARTYVAAPARHARMTRGQPASIEKPSTIRGEAQRLLYDWKWLSLFFNHVNTSMGKPPLYPFEIPPPVIRKLGFGHRLIRETALEHVAQR